MESSGSAEVDEPTLPQSPMAPEPPHDTDLPHRRKVGLHLPCLPNLTEEEMSWLEEAMRDKSSIHGGMSRLDDPRQVVYEHSMVGNLATPLSGHSFTALSMYEEVWIGWDGIEEVDRVCDSHENVQSALTNLLDSLLGGGLSVAMDYIDEAIEIEPRMQRMFDNEWHTFVRDLVTSLLKFGFAVVRLVPSSEVSGQLVPMVVEKETYSISFVYSFDRRRMYRVYRNDTTMGWSKLSKEQRKNKRYGTRASSRDNVFVYTLPGSEPRADGTLRSPLSTVTNKIRVLEHSYENFMRTDYRQSRPVYAVATGADRPAPVDVLGTQVVPEAETGAYIGEEKAKKQEVDREEIEEAARVTHHQSASMSLQEAEQGRVGRLGPNPIALETPIKDLFAPGIGRTVVAGPPPAFNPHFPELTRIVSGIVCGVLGIPMQLLSTTQEVHAANAEVAFRIYDKRIRGLQRLIQPILQDLFELIYAMDHTKIRTQYAIQALQWAAIESEEENDKNDDDEEESSTTRKGKNHRKRKAPRAGTRESEPAANRIQDYIESSGLPNKSGPHDKADGGKSIARGFELSKVMGDTVLLDEDGRSRRSKFGHAKPPKRISLEMLKALVAKNVRFKISFHQAPLTTPADIQMLWEQDLIPFEVYSTLMGEIIGIDPSMMLTERQSNAQREKKMKTQTDLDVKYAPPVGPDGKPLPTASSAAAGKPRPGGAKPAAAAGGAASRPKPSAGGSHSGGSAATKR